MKYVSACPVGKEVVWQLAFALMEVDMKGHGMDAMGDVGIEEWMGRRGDDWERWGKKAANMHRVMFHALRITYVLKDGSTKRVETFV